MATPSGRAREPRVVVLAALVGAALGYVAGALLFAGVAGGLSEAVKRYAYKLQGGGGEGAYWGEPLFYVMLLLVLPSAGNIGGAIVGAFLAVWLARVVAAAGGLSASLRRYAVLLAALWLLVAALASCFVHSQWTRAREEVARYREATEPRAIVWAPPDPAALEEMRKGCDKGFLPACHRLGVMYEQGEGVAAAAPQALAFYERGCSGGDAPSCREMGSLAQRGAADVPPDLTRTKALYEKACGLGDGWSCFTVGVMHERGQATPKDFVQAAAFYRRSCDVRYGMGCQYLGDSYSHGEGVARDDARGRALYAQAAALLEKECDGGEAHSCLAAGTMYRTGQGVAADPQRSHQLLVRGCRGGNKDACAAAGMSPAGLSAGHP